MILFGWASKLKKGGKTIKYHYECLSNGPFFFTKIWYSFERYIDTLFYTYRYYLKKIGILISPRHMPSIMAHLHLMDNDKK